MPIDIIFDKLKYPVRPRSKEFSTHRFYKDEKVTLGKATSLIDLSDDIKIMFTGVKPITTDRVDERNLKFCKYLNLSFVSIAIIDTKYLINLYILILSGTNLRTLNTMHL